MKKVSYFSLFITFSKIGLFTFGGGISMLPMLERECVVNKKWATEEEMLNYFSIGQCTPGIIAVNTATFIGYKIRGFLGGVIATLGIVSPSFFIILFLSSIINIFYNNYYFLKAFYGIRIAVCSLLTISVINLLKKTIKSLSCFIIAVLVFISEFLFSLSPVLLVFLTLIYAFLYYYFKYSKNKMNR